LITFYTALWHTQLLPRINSDYDGEYLSFNDEDRISHKTMPLMGFDNYMDDFSMWDIYRAQIPLFNLIYIDHVRDMVISLLKKAEQGGWLPIFPAWNSYTDEMIGDHCAVLIGDAFQKGIIKTDTNQDLKLLFSAYYYTVKNALSIPTDIEYKKGKGRRALRSYLEYGFIPLEDEVLDSAHIKQQVSRTLEYSYDDYVISQLALLYSKVKEKEYIRNVSDIFDETMAFVMAETGEVRKTAITVADTLLKNSQNYQWLIDADGKKEKYKHD